MKTSIDDLVKRPDAALRFIPQDSRALPAAFLRGRSLILMYAFL